MVSVSSSSSSSSYCYCDIRHGGTLLRTGICEQIHKRLKLEELERCTNWKFVHGNSADKLHHPRSDAYFSIRRSPESATDLVWQSLSAYVPYALCMSTSLVEATVLLQQGASSLSGRRRSVESHDIRASWSRHCAAADWTTPYACCHMIRRSGCSQSERSSSHLASTTGTPATPSATTGSCTTGPSDQTRTYCVSRSSTVWHAQPIWTRQHRFPQPRGVWHLQPSIHLSDLCWRRPHHRPRRLQHPLLGDNGKCDSRTYPPVFKLDAAASLQSTMFNLSDFTVNLSSYKLDAAQVSILDKGLTFIPSTRHIPCNHILDCKKRNIRSIKLLDFLKRILRNTIRNSLKTYLSSSPFGNRPKIGYR